MNELNHKELSFPEYCGKMYGIELAKTLQAEIESPALLPQSAFSSNRARGKAISFDAETKVDNFKALTVLLHREIKHEEIYTEEKEIVSEDLTDGEIEAATFYAQSWWLN